MRAAVVLDRFDLAGGGLERWTIGFASFLAGRGHDVHVVAFETAPEPPVPVHVLLPARGGAGRARRVAACVARLEADVVLDTGTGWFGRRVHAVHRVAPQQPAAARATQPPASAPAERDLAAVGVAGLSMARLERAQVPAGAAGSGGVEQGAGFAVRAVRDRAGACDGDPEWGGDQPLLAGRIGPLRAAARRGWGGGATCCSSAPPIICG